LNTGDAATEKQVSSVRVEERIARSPIAKGVRITRWRWLRTYVSFPQNI